MKPTKNGGGSQIEDEGIDAPREGGEDRTGSAEERLGSREALFAAIDAKRNAGVQEDIDYAFATGDPAAAQAEADRRKNVKPADADTGVVTKTAAAPAPAEEADADTDVDVEPALPPEVVMQGGKAMLKLKVDGREKFVPLDSAIATLQKGEAAEVRLQSAAELRKNLDARQAELDAREARLKSQSSAPPAATDADLEAEAQGLVDSLLTDDPKVAAKKLSGVLVKVRQAARPSIDENTLVAKAVQATRQSLRADDHATSLKTGLTKFQAEYSDIASDPMLERVADGKTETIAVEHPEWTPEQVMLEAGKQTREWVQSLRGEAPARQNPKPDLAADRRDRKVGLRPLPQQRTGRPTQAKPADQAETPQSIVAAMRAARGQA
jgi:hypothetical protein